MFYGGVMLLYAVTTVQASESHRLFFHLADERTIFIRWIN